MKLKKKRFTNQACELVSNAAAFYPRHVLPTSMSKVESFANFYKFDINQPSWTATPLFTVAELSKMKTRFQHASERIDRK